MRDWTSALLTSNTSSMGKVSLRSEDRREGNYVNLADHQNWFGIDENLGPVAVSIRRERVPATGEESRLGGLTNTAEHFMYRLIVRTSDLLPLRGTVLEDSIPALKSEKIKTIPTKDVLEFCFPELQLTR